MQASIFRRSLLKVLLGALWVSALAAPRAARAANPIVMEVGSPLALTDRPLSVQARFRRWFPVAVTLSNNGDPVQGTLALKLSSSSGDAIPTSTFVAPVDLPTVARKRVWLYARLERTECDTAEVTFEGRGIETLRARFDVSQPDERTRLVLTISDVNEKLSYLSGLKGSGLALPPAPQPGEANYGFTPPGRLPSASNSALSPNTRLIQPLGQSHEMVPERWIGLDTADLVVLHDFPHTALSPGQIAALRGYVAGGGTLVVLGGANWQRLAQSPLSDLWPLSPQAANVASPAEKSTLVDTYLSAVAPQRRSAGDRLGGAPALVTRGTLRPRARLLAGTAEFPILSVFPSGAGQVRLLAIDPTKPPFLGWNGNVELWRAIFGGTEPPPRLESVDTRLAMPGYSSPSQSPFFGYRRTFTPTDPTTRLLGELYRTPQLRTPPISSIAWFLALYVFILVPLNYSVLRFFDKRELAWITVPAIVLVFSVASYAAALNIKGSMVRTRHINIVQGSHQSGAARVDAMLWLFSPRKSTYSIESRDPAMAVADYIAADGENSGATVAQPAESSMRVENSLINMWDWRTFVGHSVANLGGGVTVSKRGARLAIDNRTPFDWRGAVLVAGGRVFAYGDIAAGTKSATVQSSDTIDLVDPSLIGRIITASQLERVFRDDRSGGSYHGMANAALSLALGPEFGQTETLPPFLIAWSAQPVSALAVRDEKPRAQDVTLFVFRLPNERALLASSPEAVIEAPVRLVEEDSVDTSPQSTFRNSAPRYYGWNENLERRFVYECELPQASDGAWRHVNLTARGTTFAGEARPRYDPLTRRWRTPTPRVSDNAAPAQVEIWNFARGRWQPLAGRFGFERGAQRVWSFESRLPAEATRNLVREPDGRVRLRLRTRQRIVRTPIVRVQVR